MPDKTTRESGEVDDGARRRRPWYHYAAGIIIATSGLLTTLNGFGVFSGTAVPATAAATAAPPALVTSAPLPVPIEPDDFACHIFASGLHMHQCPCEIDYESVFPGSCAEFEEWLE